VAGMELAKIGRGSQEGIEGNEHWAGP
jgi:hypothetical protein